MGDGGEDGVGGVAGSSLEIAAAEMALSFHMADHGLDSGTASQFALDGAEHAAILAGDEDAVSVRRRTRVVGAFPDGQSCLNLAAARLRHIAGTTWSAKCYMNMQPLYAQQFSETGAVA